MCAPVASACLLTAAPVHLADQALAEYLRPLCFPRLWDHLVETVSLSYKKLPRSVPSQPGEGAGFQLVGRCPVWEAHGPWWSGQSFGLEQSTQSGSWLSRQELLVFCFFFPKIS